MYLDEYVIQLARYRYIFGHSWTRARLLPGLIFTFANILCITAKMFLLEFTRPFFFRYSWFYTQIHDVEPSVVIHMEAACFVTYLKEVLSVFLSICTGRLKFMTISSVCKRYASPRNLHIVYLHDALSTSKVREQQSNVRPRRCKNKPVSKTQNKLKLWKVINPFGLA